VVENERGVLKIQICQQGRPVCLLVAVVRLRVVVWTLVAPGEMGTSVFFVRNSSWNWTSHVEHSPTQILRLSTWWAVTEMAWERRVICSNPSRGRVGHRRSRFIPNSQLLT
jgi:hypothetical protein